MTLPCPVQHRGQLFPCLLGWGTSNGTKDVTTIARVFLSGSLLAQAISDVGKGADIYALAKDFGVPAAIVMFVLSEGRQREARFEKRIASNELFARKQLVELFQLANEEVHKNTHVISQLVALLASQGVKINTDFPPQRKSRRQSDPAIAELPDDLPKD